MSLVVAQWGGHIHSSNTANAPVEQWSNSLSLIGPASPDLEGIIGEMLSPLESWFGDPNTFISATVSLDWLKCNEFDVATGHQISDPTHEYLLPTPVRGAVVNDYSPPLTQSYKVTIDDGTRNRRHKGGWFVPRVDCPIEHDGTWQDNNEELMMGLARLFLISVNGITGITPGVWSRADHSVTAVSRVRVGNVPDNMRSRKNELTEAYAAGTV